MHTSDLAGQVAIVTGGGRGIGRAICQELAEAGARVVAVDIDAELAAAAAEALRGEGYEALGLAADISQRADVEGLVATTLARWSQLDILVNNAGIGSGRPVLELTDDEWQRVLGVNLTGVFLCSQVAARHMVNHGHGRIINIASTAALFGAPGQSAYAASKAGVLGLTRVMAVDLGSSHITVNAVCPGNIDTELLQSVYAERATGRGITVPELKAGILAKIPAGRLGDPGDVAAVVAFLASSGAEYITGQAITVCGGRSINLS